MKIVVQVYNDVDRPEWLDVRCNACGQVICQTMGDMVNVVLNANLPKSVFKMGSTFTVIKCRRCKELTNLVITPYKTLHLAI